MQSAKSWLLQHSFIPHQHFTCFIYFLYVLSVFIFLQPQGLKPARLLCLCFMLIFEYTVQFGSVQFSSVAHSCLTLCDPMNRSTPGLPVHHQLLEFTQTHVHRISDAIQPSHPLLSPSKELPRSVGAQYATGDQWRNNSRKNEGMEPKQKQYPAVDVTGDRSKV